MKTLLTVLNFGVFLRNYFRDNFPNFIPGRILGVILLCLPGVLFGQSAETIFIDSRLLLSAHPLWKQFDPATHRFVGTVSDPTLVKEIGMEGLERKILETEEALQNLPRELKKNLASVSQTEQDRFERAYIREKRHLEEELTVLRGQRYFVKDLPGRPIFSEVGSILPQVTQMASDVIHIVQSLKQAHQARIVMDISSLMPFQSTPCDSQALLGFGKTRIDRTLLKPSMKDHFFEALVQAKNFWQNRETELSRSSSSGGGGFDSPILVGALDCRFEAVEKMKQFSEAEKSE